LFLGYVTDEELNNLYQNAFCFVLPSLYEGFGIPVLEAMAYNCPVISSFASSLPEIGADACLYFDPKDQSDLLDKLNMLQQNKTLRLELIKKGKERIKQFSWRKCGEETLNILTDVKY
jgi:glycosyltransferase involved in cell wall biosynthesis